MKFRLLVIVEAVIVLLLAMQLFVGRPGFIPVAILALVFMFLTNRAPLLIQKQIFGLISLLAWLVIIVFVLTTGYFWLALIWPIVWAAIFARSGNRPADRTQRPQGFRQNFGQSFQENYARARRQRVGADRSGGPRDVTADGEDATVSPDRDELIDLATLVFRPDGNTIAIKKAAGNTKILVPTDVAVSVSVASADGLVRLMDQPPVMDGAARYQSENFESASKRVTLEIRTEKGNIEVISA